MTPGYSSVPVPVPDNCILAILLCITSVYKLQSWHSTCTTTSIGVGFLSVNHADWFSLMWKDLKPWSQPVQADSKYLASKWCIWSPPKGPPRGVYGHHLKVLEGHYHIHFCHDESTRGGVGKHCFIELLDEWIPHKTFCGSTVSYYSERSQFKLVLAHTIKVTRAIPQCVQDKPWPTVFCPLGQIHIVCPKHQILGFLS